MMAAKVCGCTKIIAVDILNARPGGSPGAGATHAINSKTTEDVSGKIREITRAAGTDYAFDTTGIPSCLRSANLCIRSGGRPAALPSPAPLSWTRGPPG
jgi:aryl-alcohol dehydrogenase